MQDEFDGGMGIPDDELTGGSAGPDMGEGGPEPESGGGEPGGGRRSSGGARARKSGGGSSKPAGGPKGGGSSKGAKKSSGAAKKGAAKKGALASRELQFTTIAFAVAPLFAALSLTVASAIHSETARDVASFFGWTIVFYFYAVSLSLPLSLPVFLVLRKLGGRRRRQEVVRGREPDGPAVPFRLRDLRHDLDALCHLEPVETLREDDPEGLRRCDGSRRGRRRRRVASRDLHERERDEPRQDHGAKHAEPARQDTTPRNLPGRRPRLRRHHAGAALDHAR